VFRATVFPAARHGGPGSCAAGLPNAIRLAVGKTAMPYRSLVRTLLSRTTLSLPPPTAIPIPMKPASGVLIGTRARPLPVTVLRTIDARRWGACASFAYVFGRMPAPLRSHTESRMTTSLAFVPE
jgi:hypothetical protein